MRCTEENCNGLVIYENTGSDIKEAIQNLSYIVDNYLVCDTCGKKFKAIYFQP